MHPINDAQIDSHYGNDQVHIPILVRDDVIEQLQQGVGRGDGEHIIDLNNLTRRVGDTALEAIAVDQDVDEVDHRIAGHRNDDGRNDTLSLKLDQTQFHQKDRNAQLEHVREILEDKRPAQQLEVRRGIIDNDRKQGTQ